jgi:DNA-binding response OmpR family regulator
LHSSLAAPASAPEFGAGRRSVTCDGHPIELTTTEFDLLRALMESAGRVLSREALLDRAADRDRDPVDDSDHSERSASTGLTEAARRAGM